MPNYKRQHYLPCAYLKYFSDDQSNCNRQSFVWRFDGKKMNRVPVHTQCFADYFYSKEKAAETENMFQKREEIYCRFVDKIRAGEEPPRKSFGDFFLCMFDLHLRNAIHKNLTGQEGVDAYNMRITMFLIQVLVGCDPTKFSTQVVKNHIQSNWRMEIIPAPVDYQFITSDHPVVFLTFKKLPSEVKGALQMILLSIDPGNIAVAFDRRFLKVRQKTATSLDVQTTNFGQAQNGGDCVYSSRALVDHEIKSLGSMLGQKTPLKCELTAEGWKMLMSSLPPERLFSFVELKPPLF